MNYEIDQAQTQTMISMLSPTGEGLTFQSFDDNTDRANKALIKQYHGSLSTNAQRLEKLNQQGAGVFITVNSTDGIARKKENITSVRALYVDFDSVEPERLDMLLCLHIPPNLVIESSTAKHHAYWVADGIPLDNFTLWQKQLIAYFKSIGDAPDEAVHDLPRVMRLAGFSHCKVSSKKGLTGEPFLTRIVHQGQRYSIDDIEQFIDSLPAQQTTEQANKTTQNNKQASSPILPQILNDSQLPSLSAERVRDLARGRWQDILRHLNHHVSNDIKEHSQCPICGGGDRFRFDDKNGTGSFICSQGTGKNIAGDGLSLLADHAGLGILEATKAVTAVLNDMGLLSSHDDKTKHTSTDWADPKPISHTLPPVTSITPNMLPETLYSYVINTANRLSVPLEFVAVPLVVALGSVIGTKVSIFPKRHDDWQVIPNLWGAVIGQPSSKKSPAIDNAMKPIDNLISKAMKAHKSNMKEHATQTLINTAKAKAESDELKSLAKQLASQDDDIDSAEKITEETIHQKAAAIAESKQQDENIPIPRRHMVSDITVEKLGEIENQNNNGVLQYRDELSGFLANLEKDSEQQARSFYLEGFNGTGSYTVDRIMRGSLFIENHCLSVMGGIQPDKLEMYLEKTMRGLGNDGLIQRFQMMVYPDPLPRTKEKDIAVDKESRDAVYSLFIAADELHIGTLKRYGANEANNFYKRPHFRFVNDAYTVFMSWLDNLNDKADNAEHDVIAQHLIKYGRLIPALALIFHLVECIEVGSRLGGVSLNALQAAIAWGDMLETHMLRVYSCVTDNSHLKASLLSKKILEMLKKPSDKTDKTNWVSHGFTARSLKRKNWKGLTDDEAVQTALDVLIEYDWLNYEVVNSTGQGGRPTERYWINPKLKAFI